MFEGIRESFSGVMILFPFLLNFGIFQGILDVRHGKEFPGRGNSLNKGMSLLEEGSCLSCKGVFGFIL